MDRRRIPSIPGKGPQKGDYARKWDGFKKALQKVYWDIDELDKWNPRPIRSLEEGGVQGVEDVSLCWGVYVFLNKDKYVLYVGKGSKLAERIKRSFKGRPRVQRDYIRYVAAHQVHNAVETDKMEKELRNYYHPPWNRQF
jgi:hypothetical protein